jgi:hypothetical protein
MLVFNLLVPVVYALALHGGYNNVAKPVAKTTYETGVVVYEKSVAIIKDITTDDVVTEDSE